MSDPTPQSDEKLFGDCEDVPEKLCVTEFGDGCTAIFVTGDGLIAHFTKPEMRRLGTYLICLLYTSPSPRDRG